MPTSRTGARTHVAFLRAINVGGRNGLPMKDLVKLCEAGNGRGCVEGGIAYEKGEVTGKSEMDRAKVLYVKGCGAKKPDDRGCTYARR